jgi:hypothetical protein
MNMPYGYYGTPNRAPAPRQAEQRRGGRKVVAGLAGVALLVGGVWKGQEMTNWVEEQTYQIPSTQIVAGIPGQIEGSVSSHKPLLPFLPHHFYRSWLGIEQCRDYADPAARTFDPEPDLQDCDPQWIEVDKAVYDKWWRSKEPITFAGEPGAPLRGIMTLDDIAPASQP